MEDLEWERQEGHVSHVAEYINGMIGHIQELDSSKEAWDTLKRLYNTNTNARKIQLKNELNNMKKNNLSVNDYLLKIKEVSDALGSIGAPLEDDDL